MSFIAAERPTIGFATIGQTPRSDLVPYLVSKLGKPVNVLEGGVLDDLSPPEIAALDENGEGLHMVTRLRDGGSARLSYRNALPRMQTVVAKLVQEGARYGEIAIVARSADRYDGILDSALERYHIPYYTSCRRDISTMPEIRLIYAALSVAAYDWQTEDVIAYLLKEYEADETMVMVGDTAFDVIGATAHGIPTIGVAWGYGSVAEMEKAGAVAIADTVAQLKALLLR